MIVIGLYKDNLFFSEENKLIKTSHNLSYKTEINLSYILEDISKSFPFINYDNAIKIKKCVLHLYGDLYRYDDVKKIY